MKINLSLTPKKTKIIGITALSLVLCAAIVVGTVRWIDNRRNSRIADEQINLKPTIYYPDFTPLATDFYTPLPATAPPQSYMDFTAAQEVNPEIIAWLTLYGVDIDYPVCHTNSNQYYLKHTADNQRSNRGALFIDARNAGDLSDCGTIIHGHNLNNPQMFGKLKQFGERSYFDNHTTGVLYTKNTTFSLELLALLYVNDDDEAYTFGVYAPADREAYLENIRSKAVYYRQVGETANDSFVICSTCSYTKRFPDERLLLVYVARPQ